MPPRSAWRLGAVLGALGVVLGAFGAHGLKSHVTDPHLLEVWDTGARYHLIHAVAIVAASRTRSWAPALFTLGILLFSGSLYAMALSGVRVLGAVTPFGGVSFIAGWIVLALSAPPES